MATGGKAEARRKAAETRARLRAERAKRDRTIEQEAEKVIVKLAERDAVIAACETDAGVALEKLAVMGLGTDELSEWCGGVSAREIGRLRQLAVSSAAAGGEGS